MSRRNTKRNTEEPPRLVSANLAELNVAHGSGGRRGGEAVDGLVEDESEAHGKMPLHVAVEVPHARVIRKEPHHHPSSLWIRWIGVDGNDLGVTVHGVDEVELRGVDGVSKA